MARKTIAQLELALAHSQSEVIALSGQIKDPNDPRLKTFWENAHEQADSDGLCDDFDTFVENIGGPRRPKQWDIRLDFSATVSGEADAGELADKIASFLRDNFYDDRIEEFGGYYDGEESW